MHLPTSQERLLNNFSVCDGIKETDEHTQANLLVVRLHKYAQRKSLKNLNLKINYAPGSGAWDSS